MCHSIPIISFNYGLSGSLVFLVVIVEQQRSFSSLAIIAIVPDRRRKKSNIDISVLQ